MTREPNQPIEAIVNAQRTLIRALHAAGSSWLELNLTMAQLKTLIVLSDDGPLHVGQVGCRMGVTLPTASYQVDRLVRAGLVRRVEDTRDRRRTLVHLTPKAEELLRELRQGRAGLLRSWLGQMSMQDLEALEQGLTALESVVREQPVTSDDQETVATPSLVSVGQEESAGEE